MWILATFMYLMFYAGQNDPATAAVYKAFVDNGAPCYVYMAGWGNEDPNKQPTCWYDPSNTNPGNTN